MKIKVIDISNYRKINNAKINMEDSLTVLAGANNSGKTSLVELFNAVFGCSKGKLRGEDIPVKNCNDWSDSAYSVFYAIFSSKKPKEETITDICDSILSLEKPEEALLMPPITVKVQVDYDENEDDIINFADYIMEFDPSNKSFYFIYQFELNHNVFRKNLNTNFEKILARFEKIIGSDNTDNKTLCSIKEMLIKLYAGSCEETAYFSDRSYTNAVSMDVVSFKALFNFKHIIAGRTLDDEKSDKSRHLSKNMIDIASQEEDWQSLTRNLPDQIIQPIQDAKIQDKVRAASIESLSNTIEAISKTNGGQAGNIVIDMEVTEDAINSLLKNITCAKYQMGENYLSESSQGLGYSNLIYIHLELEKYKKAIDPLIVNFFVIEEPESHMHPQMQNVFAQYLCNYYKNEKIIQGMLTTHSHEVVRNALITQLRVLRQVDSFICNIYDLREFIQSISQQDLLEFYDWFYTINFPDIIFADKIIIYEGDTERMLIKRALQLNEFEILRNQYISFVQVGGAYAHNYLPIIDYLGIKSVIITDLDYDKLAKTDKDVLNSHISNSTIKKITEKELHDPNPKVQTLYDWKSACAPIVIKNVCLAFQGKEENFARTLEEAMLAMHYGISALEEKTRDEWENLRKADRLKYTIPREEPINIRNIVLHTSNTKTDFMYSVILNNLAETMLPHYIKEALIWLKS